VAAWRVDGAWRARLERFAAPRVGRLGPRLSAVAGCVPAGSAVADVGADHGRLGAELLRAGLARRVVAIDRSEAALAGAAAALAPWRDRGGSVALGDGLEAPGAKGCDCAVLAGLGGKAIAGIVERAAAAGALPQRVVAQPLTGHHLVRDALARAGRGIVDERLDLDGDRVVLTMAADAAAAVPAAFDPHSPIRLEMRAAESERDRAFLDGWLAAQEAWLESARRGGPRAAAVRAALARRGGSRP